MTTIKPSIDGGSTARRRASRSGLAALLFLVAAAPAPAAPPVVQISTCNGAVVPPHQKGVLAGDVHCGMHCDLNPSAPCDDQGVSSIDPTDSCSADSIALGRGSVLNLAGHVLTGAYNASAVRCIATTPGGSCSVVGPGIVQSTKGAAVSSLGMSIHVRGVKMYGNYGALESDHAVFARDSAFGNWDGDAGARAIHLTDVTSTGHDGGFRATRSISVNRVATGSGLHAGARIVGTHLTLTESPCPPIDAPIVHLSDVTPPGCAP